MIEQVPFWMYIAGFLLLLGPLVTLHELGHYLVGRWFGVKAVAFSVGFGREIVGWTDRRGTRWKLSWLPLGGYVQFKGDMNPASVPHAADDTATSAERDGAFQYAALWKRALIVFAGPAANILITLGIFAAFFMAVGVPQPSDADEQLTVAAVMEDSAARAAGIEPGDRIVSIGDTQLASLRDLQQAVALYPGERRTVGFVRDGETRSVDVTLGSMEVTDRFGNASRIGMIGIEAAGASYDYVAAGPVEAGRLAVTESVKLTAMMVTGVAQIVRGDRSVEELGGPIKIAKYSGEQLSLGPLAFANLAALISLNLAFINLLPIPALDGGHLAFYASEAIRRKPVGAKGMEMAYRTGIALVLALMLFVTFNDLLSLSALG